MSETMVPPSCSLTGRRRLLNKGVSQSILDRIL